MILTCPSCGTQYVVKDGAIPPQGRQVRCAACKHSWHQDGEPVEASADEETVAEAALIDPSSGPEAEERAYEEAALAAELPATRPRPGDGAPAGYAPIAPPDLGDEFEAPAERGTPSGNRNPFRSTRNWTRSSERRRPPHRRPRTTSSARSYSAIPTSRRRAARWSSCCWSRC